MSQLIMRGSGNSALKSQLLNKLGASGSALLPLGAGSFSIPVDREAAVLEYHHGDLVVPVKLWIGRW
jgi:hypothetical protein